MQSECSLFTVHGIVEHPTIYEILPELNDVVIEFIH